MEGLYPHSCDEIDSQGDVRCPLVHHQDAVRQHDHLRFAIRDSRLGIRVEASGWGFEGSGFRGVGFRVQGAWALVGAILRQLDTGTPRSGRRFGVSTGAPHRE